MRDTTQHNTMSVEESDNLAHYHQMSDPLAQYLEKIGLTTYAPLFAENGFATVADCSGYLRCLLVPFLLSPFPPSLTLLFLSTQS
jgi:hypothetical protein